MSSYTKAIELNPHLSGSRKNLAQLLTSYAPHEEISHPIVKVNQEIKKIITINGIRFTLEDGSWGLVRASSNKPSLVVVVESTSSEKRKKLSNGLLL